MNPIRTSLAAVALLVGLGFGAAAQEQKIAYTNPDSIALALPSMQKAIDSLTIYAEQLQGEVTSMEEELGAKYEDYRANGQTYTPLVLAEKEREINQLSQRLQRFRQSVRQDLRFKEQQLFGPIYKRIREAVTAVAKEGGYNFVFTQSDEGRFPFLIAPEADDVTQRVIDKLVAEEEKAPASEE